MSDVNSKFIAVVLESQGGGAFLVAPLSKVSEETIVVFCLTFRTHH